jgi:hypothetical protein
MRVSWHSLGGEGTLKNFGLLGGDLEKFQDLFQGKGVLEKVSGSLSWGRGV